MKSAKNLVLIADSESTQKSVQNRTGIIDLQNDFNMFVAKQWKIIISVPMSYINNFYKNKTMIIIKKSPGHYNYKENLHHNNNHNH